MHHEKTENNVKVIGWNIFKSNKQEVGIFYLSWQQQSLQVQNCQYVLKAASNNNDPTPSMRNYFWYITSVC